MFRKRLMQRLAVAFLLLAVSFSGIMTAAAATTDRFYISRIIAWREGEFRDFEKFPSRPVPAGPKTFFFKPAPERTPEYLRTVTYRRDTPDPTTPRESNVYAARNATVVGNRTTDNVAGGIAVGKSVNTTVAQNHVIGGPETQAAGIHVQTSSHTTVVKNEVRGLPEGPPAVEVEESIDTTVAENDLIGNGLGVYVEDSTGTKILYDVVSHFGIIGTLVVGQKSVDTKVVGNDISGGPEGIFVTDAHGGSFVGNKVHDNCAGMFFEAFGP